VKNLKMAGAVVVVSLVVAQAFPIGENNPAVVCDVNAPPQIKGLMGRSCYWCHSIENVKKDEVTNRRPFGLP